MSEVTQEMVDAFKEAWESKREEIADGDAFPGTKTRAGLEAVIALSRRAAVRDAIAQELGDDIYICWRDVSAWGYGTMHLEDFSLATENEDVLDRITDSVLAALSKSSIGYGQ